MAAKSNVRRKAIERGPVRSKVISRGEAFDNRPTLEEYDKRRVLSKYVTWSEALEDQIAGLVSEGYTLNEIGQLKSFPVLSTMLRRMLESERFADLLLRAREVAVYALADQIITIADEANPDTVQVAKLRVEVRQWVMGRFNRRQFGDRVDVDGMLGGAAGKLSITWQGEERPSNPSASKVVDVTVSKPSPLRDGSDAVDITPDVTPSKAGDGAK